MCGIKHTHLSSVHPRSVYREFRNTPVSLPTADYRKLQEHLEACERDMRPGARLLAYVLANKLINTRPWDGVHDAGLVVGGACVTCVIDGQEPKTGLLVHSVMAEPPDCIIPVASLLGATLIGMRVGQRAPLLFEDCTIGRLSVKSTEGPA